MTAATLTRPALRPLPGPAAGALVAPHHDPRPCVTRPAQWWDIGDTGNARAVRYCRNVCPLRDTCTPVGPPKGQILAGRAYNHNGKRLTICGRCDHPRVRPSTGGAIRCGCPTNQTRAERDAERQARKQARLAEAARRKANPRQYIPGDVLIARWLPLHQQGLNAKEAAVQLGVRHATLKGAIARARRGGDPRVPASLRGAHRRTRQVAA